MSFTHSKSIILHSYIFVSLYFSGCHFPTEEQLRVGKEEVERGFYGEFWHFYSPDFQPAPSVSHFRNKKKYPKHFQTFSTLSSMQFNIAYYRVFYMPGGATCCIVSWCDGMIWCYMVWSVWSWVGVTKGMKCVSISWYCMMVWSWVGVTKGMKCVSISWYHCMMVLSWVGVTKGMKCVSFGICCLCFHLREAAGILSRCWSLLRPGLDEICFLIISDL